MTRDDLAINIHVINANAMEISNPLQFRQLVVLQKSTSRVKRTTTPAEEQAAASDKMAVT